MTKYRIVLVPFPFDDLSSTKVRPAVCLTDPIGPYRHLILAFITSRVPTSPLPTDFIIDSTDKAFSLTGLHVSSTIQLHRMITVTTRLIRRELGVIPPRMQSDRGTTLQAIRFMIIIWFFITR
jgi:mRNA interferase MazF